MVYSQIERDILARDRKIGGLEGYEVKMVVVNSVSGFVEEKLVTYYAVGKGAHVDVQRRAEADFAHVLRRVVSVTYQ